MKQTQLAVKTIRGVLPGLFFAAAALLLAPRYLVSEFNSQLVSDSQKLGELLIFYYGSLSVPVAWSVFPSVLGLSRARAYAPTLLMALVLVAARAATYLNFSHIATGVLGIIVGPIVMHAIRSILQSKVHEPIRGEPPLGLIASRQLGAALTFFGFVISSELFMLIFAGARLTFGYMTAGLLALFSMIFGLTASRTYLVGFTSESISYYVTDVVSRMRPVEKRFVILGMSFAGILSAHILYAFQNKLGEILRALILVNFGNGSSLTTIVSTGIFAIALALLLALLIVPAWTNGRTLGMSEEAIDRILRASSGFRTPLVVQDFLSTIIFGLIKIELFFVVPLTVLGVQKRSLLTYPSEAYILVVTALFLVAGQLITRLLTRNYWLYATAIIVAPISILFSISLDFFHTDLKRRFVRYYARFHQELPEIVRRLEEVASNDKDRLMLRLIAFYGLTDEELLGSRKLPGVRPGHVNFDEGHFVLYFKERKSKRTSVMNIPLEDITRGLFESVITSLPPDSRIFTASKWALWARVRSMAKLANIWNPYRITPYRLRGHFLTYVLPHMPALIRNALVSQKYGMPENIFEFRERFRPF